MATINYFIEVLWRFFVCFSCFCFFACFCFCFYRKVNLFERNRMMVKATFVYLDLRILKVVASSFYLLSCCLINGMYQSWCFLFQVTESPSELAKMDNGKFIGSYNPSAEKADVDLTSGPETKDSDLFSWMFYLSNPSIIFLPSDYLLHVAKTTTTKT